MEFRCKPHRAIPGTVNSAAATSVALENQDICISDAQIINSHHAGLADAPAKVYEIKAAREILQKFEPVTHGTCYRSSISHPKPSAHMHFSIGSQNCHGPRRRRGSRT